MAKAVGFLKMNIIKSSWTKGRTIFQKQRGYLKIFFCRGTNLGQSEVESLKMVGELVGNK